MSPTDIMQGGYLESAERRELSQLIGALLDFEALPGRYPLMLREPRTLFECSREVLLLASGRSVTGLSIDSLDAPFVQRAACFFVRMAMLRPGADHYTLLGLEPGFKKEALREHYRMLIRLTHPDFEASSGTWPAGAATRINLANDVLSSVVRKAEYDGVLANNTRRMVPMNRLGAVLPRPLQRERHVAWGWILAGSGAFALVLTLLSSYTVESHLAQATSADLQVADDEAGSVAESVSRKSQEQLAQLIQMAKKTEADQLAEVSRQAEVIKLAEAAKVAAAAKLAQAAKDAQAVKLVEVEKQSQLAKKAEIAKMAEVTQQAEAAKVAEAARVAEVAKAVQVAKDAQAVKLAEAAKKAEAAKVAEAMKQAEVAKLTEAAQIAKNVQALKLAEAAKKAEALKFADATKQAQLAKLTESTKAAQAAKDAEAAKIAEAVKEAQVAKLSQVARAAQEIPVAQVVATAASFKPPVVVLQAHQSSAASDPVGRLTLADVQPALNQLIQAMQAGRGEDLLRGLDRSVRLSAGAADLVNAYNFLVDGSRAVRLGPVQLRGRPNADQLAVDGVVQLVLHDQGQPPPVRELRLRALFAQRDGQVVMTELSAGGVKP